MRRIVHLLPAGVAPEDFDSAEHTVRCHMGDGGYRGDFDLIVFARWAAERIVALEADVRTLRHAALNGRPATEVK